MRRLSGVVINLGSCTEVTETLSLISRACQHINNTKWRKVNNRSPTPEPFARGDAALPECLRDSDRNNGRYAAHRARSLRGGSPCRENRRPNRCTSRGELGKRRVMCLDRTLKVNICVQPHASSTLPSITTVSAPVFTAAASGSTPAPAERTASIGIPACLRHSGRAADALDSFWERHTECS